MKHFINSETEREETVTFSSQFHSFPQIKSQGKRDLSCKWFWHSRILSMSWKLNPKKNLFTWWHRVCLQTESTVWRLASAHPLHSTSSSPRSVCCDICVSPSHARLESCCTSSQLCLRSLLKISILRMDLRKDGGCRTGRGNETVPGGTGLFHLLRAQAGGS